MNLLRQTFRFRGLNLQQKFHTQPVDDVAIVVVDAAAMSAASDNTGTIVQDAIAGIVDVSVLIASYSDFSNLKVVTTHIR
jgi:hypothetical protein